MIRVKPINTEAQLQQARDAAITDGHVLVAPTHIISNEGGIIGALSIIPTVLVWSDTQRTKIRDSIMIKNFYEDYLACGGNRVAVVPCTPESPYFHYLSKDGYHNMGPYHLFVKGVQ